MRSMLEKGLSPKRQHSWAGAMITSFGCKPDFPFNFDWRCYLFGNPDIRRESNARCAVLAGIGVSRDPVCPYLPLANPEVFRKRSEGGAAERH